MRLRLVLALQRAVVALVEPPVAAHGEPAPSRSGEGELGGADGPGQEGGVENPQVEGPLGVARFLGSLAQQEAAVAGLVLPGWGQVDIDPAREAVLGVPGGLAVPDQHQVEGPIGCIGHETIVGVPAVRR